METYAKELSLICLPLQKKYKSHIEIIALILDAARFGGAARYSIMKRTGINYAQLKKYLGSLSKIGFVEVCLKEGEVIYKASENGLAFLSQYSILRDMLISACFQNKPINVIHNGYAVPNLQHPLPPLATRFARRS